MKIKWLKNLVSEGNKDCYEFTNNIFDINKLFNSGIKYCETLCKAIKNDFWRDVLGSFKIYESKCNFTTWSEVINMPLFYNENLRIGSKHFFNSTLYNHGIRYIRDVLNEDGSFKTWNDIKNATSNGINFLEFYSIISSVKSFFSKQDIASESNLLQGLEGPNINCYFFNIITRLNSNKFIYNILIKNNERPSCHIKWNALFPNSNIDWKTVHINVFNCTSDRYSQWFQTRLIHRILPTNSLLFKMNLTENKLCSFCNTCEETLQHLFFECPKIKPLMKRISEIIRNLDRRLLINKQILLLGSVEPNLELDNLLLELKIYLYKCRNKQIMPALLGLKNNLISNLKIFKTSKAYEKEKDHTTFVEFVIDNLP